MQATKTRVSSVCAPRCKSSRALKLEISVPGGAGGAAEPGELFMNGKYRALGKSRSAASGLDVDQINTIK